MPDPPWTHRTVCQLTVLGAAFGSRIVNVFHFQAEEAKETTLTSDTAAQAAGLALANSWITGEKPEYLACLPADYGMQMVRAQIIERPGQWRHRLTPSEVPSTGAGTAGAGLPTENLTTAGVIRWRTPLAGKKYRGRSYMGPVPTAWNTNGLLDTLGVTAYTTFKDAMIATYGPTGAVVSGWNLTVFSRPYNQGEYGYVVGSGSGRTVFFPPEYAGDATNVTVGAIDNTLRVQRRRELGVGA